MKYGKIVEGKFIDRPNRFIAHVEIAGKAETVHVKNTGRCRELLLPGAAVRLEQSDNPARKTLYDLVAVYKDRIGWINIDSQAPNKVVKEWLEAQDYDVVRPEYTYGNSRIDFYLEKGEHKILMEVKGCTLEINGIGYFPDAPTERGVKHLRELAAARQEGYEWPRRPMQRTAPSPAYHADTGRRRWPSGRSSRAPPADLADGARWRLRSGD